VEPPLDSGCAFRHSVVRDEQIRIHGETRQTFPFTIGVSAEDDHFASRFDSPREGRHASMNDSHCRNGEAFVVEYRDGRRTCGHIVGLHFVAALFLGNEQLAEIAFVS